MRGQKTKQPFCGVLIYFLSQIGLSLAVVLMFGNEMLFSSWLFSCLVASVVVFHVLEPMLALFSHSPVSNDKDNSMKWTSMVWPVIKLIFVTGITVLTKQVAGVVLNIKDDVSLNRCLSIPKIFQTLLNRSTIQ